MQVYRNVVFASALYFQYYNYVVVDGLMFPSVSNRRLIDEKLEIYMPEIGNTYRKSRCPRIGAALSRLSNKIMNKWGKRKRQPAIVSQAENGSLAILSDRGLPERVENAVYEAVRSAAEESASALEESAPDHTQGQLLIDDKLLQKYMLRYTKFIDKLVLTKHSYRECILLRPADIFQPMGRLDLTFSSYVSERFGEITQPSIRKCVSKNSGELDCEDFPLDRIVELSKNAEDRNQVDFVVLSKLEDSSESDRHDAKNGWKKSYYTERFKDPSDAERFEKLFPFLKRNLRLFAEPAKEIPIQAAGPVPESDVLQRQIPIAENIPEYIAGIQIAEIPIAENNTRP